MCTLTWFAQKNGYELFFTRDELKSRQIALPPFIHKKQNSRVISPTDLDAGGTWICVNSYSMSLCLLNFYEKQNAVIRSQPISRGLIIDSLSSSSALEEVTKKLQLVDLSPFRAFKLFAIAREVQPKLYTWTGTSLNVCNAPMFISSSSFNTTKVINQRQIDFSNTIASSSVESHIRFHKSHRPNKSAHSVCMHRTEAGSISLSHISVGEIKAEFNYADGPPCETDFGESKSITLDSVSVT